MFEWNSDLHFTAICVLCSILTMSHCIVVMLRLATRPPNTVEGFGIAPASPS